MAYIKAYSDENLRQPVLHMATVTVESAQEGLAKLFKVFGAPSIKVNFETRGGRSIYRGGMWVEGATITFRGHLTWLLVAHEFAHYLDYYRRSQQVAAWKKLINHAADRMAGGSDAVREAAKEQIRVLEKRITDLRKVGGHTKRHRAIVDEVCAYILEEGWHRKTILPATEQAIKEKAQATVEFHKLVAKGADPAPPGGGMWHHQVDLVQQTFAALPSHLFCPRCCERKPKEEVGVRVVSRSGDGYPTRVLRQSYCKPCRRKKN